MTDLEQLAKHPAVVEAVDDIALEAMVCVDHYGDRLDKDHARRIVAGAVAKVLAESDEPLRQAWNELQQRTDGWNWYWLSYGEKCYAFATVTAFPVDGDVLPPSGTRLELGEREREWIAEDGTRMLTDDWIANVERQNGDAVCKFIAQAYADAQRRFGGRRV